MTRLLLERLGAPSNPRLTRLLLVVDSAGVAVLLWKVGLATQGALPSAWPLVLVGLLFIACEAPLLRLRFGHNSESFDWSEAALIVGLLLVPVGWLTILVTSCTALVHTIQRRSLYKTIFNVAIATIGVALARAAYDIAAAGIQPKADTFTVRQGVALAIAGGMYWLWTGLAVSMAVSLSTATPFWTAYRRGLPIRTFVALGNISVGIGVGVLTNGNLALFLVLPPLLALVFAGNHSFLRAQQERDRWRLLEGASKGLNRLHESEVAAAALRAAAEIFRPDWVELVVYEQDGLPRRIYRRERGVNGEWSDSPITEPTLSVSTQSLPSVVHILDSDDTCAAASLRGPNGNIGALHIGFHGPVKLSRREMQVLATFTHTVATSVLNARLHERVRLEAEQHAFAATHDSLTQLANRSLFLSQLEGAIETADRTASSCALLLLDLNHFKEINDTLGHEVGDLLLCSVAQRLSEALRDGATVARLGGDEFALVVPDLPGSEAADRVAERMLAALYEPLVLEGMRFSVEACVGVACYPDDASDLHEVLRHADIAMYAAKNAGASYRHYSAERDSTNVTRLAMVAELRMALENDELLLHYQPQIDLHTKEVTGVEVLTRWVHPLRGLLPPGDFVSVVENSGLVRQFTHHVLDQALGQARRWQEMGKPIKVSVNLSTRNLVDSQFPEDVARLLAKHGVPAARLVCEVTEHAVMKDLQVLQDGLERLHALGVELSVDDFGTGYSSLALLQKVAVNELKIDRSFVHGMLTNDSDFAIVRATVDLAHALGVRVVAEGVESRALHEALLALRCDRGQGFLFGHPVPADAITPRLMSLPRQRAANANAHLRVVHST